MVAQGTRHTKIVHILSLGSGVRGECHPASYVLVRLTGLSTMVVAGRAVGLLLKPDTIEELSREHKKQPTIHNKQQRLVDNSEEARRAIKR